MSSTATILPRIFLDARNLSTGIGTYTINLAKHLHDDYNWPLHCLVTSEGKSILGKYSEQVSVSSAPIYSVREQFAVARRGWSEKLMHIPHYNIPLLARGKMLVTIHDLTHILFQGYGHRTRMKARFYGTPMLRAACKRADHIVTVSEYSKRCIVEHFGVVPSHVTVIHNGVSEVFSPSRREDAQQRVKIVCGVGVPYVLYVGSLKPHKNLPVLMRAFARVAQRAEMPLELVLAGSGDAELAGLKALAAKLGIAPRFVSGCTDAEIADLYRGAEAVVMPSLEEGFGLPVLEAMACGTPIICSEAASLPEIGGDAVLYFNPRDEGTLENALLRLLHEQPLRESLKLRGLARARQFTWRESARRHVEVYRMLLDQDGG